MRIRKVLLEDNIIPEKLAPEEDLKKLEKKAIKEEKDLASSAHIKT